VPYVNVLWKPEHLAEPALDHLCERLQGVVAEALTDHDPDHLVSAPMVDVRVGTVGPHDRIGPDLYVTVLARSEAERDARRWEIVAAITEAVRRLGVPDDTLVEFILTNRSSIYDYGDG